MTTPNAFDLFGLPFMGILSLNKRLRRASGIMYRRRLLEVLQRLPAGLVLATTLTAILRLLVAVFSEGSNDIRTWERFALEVSTRGLFKTYASDPVFNHPPLMGYYAVVVANLADFTGLRFAILFKLPMIAAEALSAALIYLTWQRRGGHLALVAALAFALNPASILVSAHHGNTDSLCAMFALLAAYQMDNQRPLGAGLALGASLNVKLITVLLVPCLAVMARARRRLAKFIVGLALSAIPFIPVLLWAGSSFKRNALDYNSHRNPWGLIGLLQSVGQKFPSIGIEALLFYERFGKVVIVCVALFVAVAARRDRTITAIRGAALVLSSFLIFAPGFGIQYVAYPVALLFCVSVSSAIIYALLAGVFAALVYAHFWTGSWPAYSFFWAPFPDQSYWIGLLAWLSLIIAVAVLLRSVRIL